MSPRLILSVFIAIPVVVLLVGVLLSFILSAPGYKGEKTDNFNGTTFINKGNVQETSFTELLKWIANRDQGEWNELSLEDAPYGEKPISRSDSTRITYVNHSTYLIQSNQLNILTDPVWSKRVSPFQFMGPKRFRPPGIAFEDLPEIDVVIISHNHYDHLDKQTVLDLKKIHDPLFLTPLGVDLYLNKIGIEKTVSLDWWEKHSINESMTIHAVPAQHFSSRGMFDRNKTLWAGYIFDTPTDTLYFAGDSGYGELFKEIGERFPSIDLAFIPIGAYIPEWFMSPIHVSPSEAAQAHLDIGSKKSIGMHYGTFPLADDGQNDPLIDLKLALESLNISQNDFLTLIEGTSIQLNNQSKSD